MSRRARAAVAAGALVLTLASCAGGTTAASGREILVFAAASLTEPFSQIGRAFEEANDRITVRFNFGPSDGLATGIVNGAPADVFASASPAWMDAIDPDPGTVDRADFARNRLTVVVPRDNAAGIRSFADLAKPGVKLVLAAPAVPAGAYARRAMANAGLEAASRNVVSNEEDVKSVLQKVVLGEADAGIVYVTDVTPDLTDALAAVAIPDAVNVTASYPIAAVRTSRDLDAARRFVAYVLGAGRAILRTSGFLAP